MARSAVFVTAVLFALGSVGTRAHDQAARSESPTLDVPAQVEFLRTAKIVAWRPIGRGVTGARRLTLSDGRVTHDAAFQSVDERSSTEDLRQGRRRAGERLFVDSYRYNIAAYQLATLLGLAHMMPVTIERMVDGRRGALSWWVDDILMDETEREAKNEQSPSGLTLNHKRQRMFVFAELVYDTDRNKGNVLYTKNWDVVMIDFTRAFRLHHTLRAVDGLEICDRHLFVRLQQLTPTDLERVTGEWLTDPEREAIMKRRDLIVARLQQLIRERGEARVLY
jgi:hypothetical protein